jgi:structural maintenance of chromosome 3 (chondroitin sulfate proteoglycan 6)
VPRCRAAALLLAHCAGPAIAPCCRTAQITSLALMKDSERLELLMEVAGCKVYDERRAESERIMKDTEMRREKVIEVVDYIEDRLRELEEEKEELKEFQTLDRDKRALEYTIYDSDLKSSQAKLQRLDEDRVELAEELKERYAKKTDLSDKTKDGDARIKALTAEKTNLDAKKKALDHELHQAAKTKTRREMDISDGNSQKEAMEAKRVTLDAQLVEVQAEVEKVEAELETVAPMYETQMEKENTLKEEIDDVERRTKALNSRQGRASEFTSKKDRDAFLKKQIATLVSTLNQQQQQEKELAAEVSSMERKAGQAEGGIDKTTANLAQLRTEVEECTQKHHDLKKERDEANNTRKELWRGNNEIEQKIQACKEASSKHERTLSTAWGRDAQKGLNAIRTLINTNKIPSKGVFGPLIELFDVDDKFVLAVETTGGGSLSHVVVDTEATAARIVKELNKQKLGRVTFMPLDTLKPKAMEEAPGPSSDVIPLISRLKFDPKFKPAFMQVFGKTLIARDTQTAATYARTHNVNCVTLEGDQVNRRGAITGGHNEQSKSRIVAMKRVKESLDEVKALSEELAKRNGQTDELEKNIADILAEMQRIKSDVRMKRQAIDAAKGQLDKDRKAQGFNSGDLQAKKDLLASVQANVRKTTKDKEEMSAELGTDLVSELSSADQKELHSLIKRKTALVKKLPACQEKRAALELEKQSLVSRLSEDLKKRKVELSEQLSELSTIGSAGDSQSDNVSDQNIERLEADLKMAVELEQKLTVDQQALDKRKQEIGKELTQLKREMDKLRKEDGGGEELAQVEQKMESLHSKRAALVSKKDTATAKIRGLGSLPADVKKYTETSSAELLKKLKKTNEKLSKYAHVNKKALDQYISFTEQKDELRGRLEELDGAKAAIQKLITVLDQRKDDAIQRTFKGVSQHFSEVFKQIVSAGKATLVMVKKRSRDQEDEADEEEDEDEEGGASAAKKRKGAKDKARKNKRDKADSRPTSSVLLYGGVSIKVSFTGHGEVYHLNQVHLIGPSYRYHHEATNVPTGCAAVRRPEVGCCIGLHFRDPGMCHSKDNLPLHGTDVRMVGPLFVHSVSTQLHSTCSTRSMPTWMQHIAPQ